MGTIVDKIILKNIPGIDDIQYRCPTKEEAVAIRTGFCEQKQYILVVVLSFSIMLGVLTSVVDHVVKHFGITDYRVWLPYAMMCCVLAVCAVRFVKFFTVDAVINITVLDGVLDGVLYKFNYGCTDIFPIGVNEKNIVALNDIFENDKRIIRSINRIVKNGNAPAIQILCTHDMIGHHHVALIYESK